MYEKELEEGSNFSSDEITFVSGASVSNNHMGKPVLIISSAYLVSGHLVMG